MILELFGLFTLISLIMIIIGLVRPSESAQALVGFTFLFLLSFVVSAGNLEYKAGELTVTTYNSSSSDIKNMTYVYTPYADSTGTFNTHIFGYFLAIVSIIGFVGVLVSLKSGVRA